VIILPLLHAPRSEDHDRAGSVMGALLAHRTQQQSREASSPARADHEQLGSFGRLDEGVGGTSFDCVALDVDVRALRDPRHPTFEVVARLSLKLFPIEHLCGHKPISGVPGDGPGIDRTDRALPHPRLLDCPAQRLHRGFGTVDSDDDHRSPSPATRRDEPFIIQSVARRAESSIGVVADSPTKPIGATEPADRRSLERRLQVLGSVIPTMPRALRSASMKPRRRVI
jgi:hypothetical protein